MFKKTRQLMALRVGMVVCSVVIVAGATGAGMRLWQRTGGIEQARRYDSLIVMTARRHGVDPALVKAVIRQESSFNPDAIGLAGEVGLMQVTPGAWADWERLNRRTIPHAGVMHDPALNIEVGTWYLARGLRQWSDRPDDQELLALCQYNAGRTRARELAARHGKIVLADISIPSTRGYIRQVLKYRAEYQSEWRMVGPNGEA